MTLEERVLIQMNCHFADELTNMDKWQKKYLADCLEKLDSSKPSLKEWNDLLRLILQKPAAVDCEDAKEQLVKGLRNGL